MNKLDFIEYLENNMQELSFEQKIITLNKIQKEWLTNYINSLLTGMKLCRKCGYYSPEKDYVLFKGSIREVDSYHGDEYEITKVYEFSTCPKCGHKQKETLISMGDVRWL